MMRDNPDPENLVGSQEPQSPNGATESLLSTCYESATGPGVQWLLGFNPEPEEPFYPQYSRHHGNETGSTSPASLQQDQQQPSTLVPENEPIFDIKLEKQTTAITMADAEPLTVDVSFADTSKEFAASTDSTELEQKKATSATSEASPIFTLKFEQSSSGATTPASRSSSIDITFTNTSQPFKAGSKPRMTRAQRREAALKAQAEAIAAKQKAEARAEEKKGEKMSRQERRAAERKAWKAALKQPRRNIVRF